jgi:hypothetical protein
MGGGLITPLAPRLDLRRSSDRALRIMLRGQRLKLLELGFLENFSRRQSPLTLRCAGIVSGLMRRLEAGLQRLDFHLAELHHALVIHDALVVLDTVAVLQGDPSAGEFGVLRGIDGFLPVEDHGER